MKNLQSIFLEFFDFGDRYSFELKDGSHYEGYPFQLFEDSFSFFSGGPLAQEDPFNIEFDKVDLDSLYFVKFSEPKWRKAKWHIDRNEWIMSD